MTPFALGFSPHVQRQARLDLFLRAHPVDVFLHLAIASVAPLHGIRRGRQQFVVEKRQGFLQGRGKELLERLAQLLEPLEAAPQVGQFVEGCLGPATPIKQRVDLFHELAEFAQLRQTPGDSPPPLAFASAQMMLDE